MNTMKADENHKLGKLPVGISLLLLLIILPLTLTTACKNNKAKPAGKQTLSGLAERSKAGLVVEGCMITGLSPEELDKYEGKHIRIEGYVSKTHPWHPGEPDSDEPIRQGFTMPAMTNIISISLLSQSNKGKTNKTE